MPSIDVAMRRSVRRGIVDLVVESLLKRQTTPNTPTVPTANDAADRTTIPDRVSSVKETFSSWDNCMAQTYCKWPVIAGIILGGLIVFSILWCMIRCCCCGMSCCCTCFSFLKCCDCCGGACDGKKNKPKKHVDDPFSPSFGGASSGYRPPVGMPIISGGYGGRPEPPQYAQFEVGRSGLAVDPKPLSEDALPPMPSWETAQKKHVVEDTPKDAVELGELDPATGQKVPLMTAGAVPGSSIPPSPVNEIGNGTPYSGRDGQSTQNGYMGVASGDPYGQNQTNLSMGYGSRSGSAANGYNSPSPQDAYGQPTNFGAAAVPTGYNRPQRQNTGDGPYNAQRNNQRPPQMGRQYTGNSSRSQFSDRSNNYNNQPPRGPSRGLGTPLNRMQSPPINNSNFDYGNNNQPYSRPDYQQQQQSYNSNRRPSPPQSSQGYHDNNARVASPYNSRNQQTPAPLEQQYSGYAIYENENDNSLNHRRDPTALRPGVGGGGGGSGKEPQGWDPVNTRY